MIETQTVETRQLSQQQALPSFAELMERYLKAQDLNGTARRVLRSHLVRFAIHLEAQGISPLTLHPEHLQAFRHLLASTPRAPCGRLGTGERFRSGSTIARAFATVRGFLGFVHHAGFSRTDFAWTLEAPRKYSLQLPFVPSTDQIRRLLGVPDVDTPLGLRDRAFLELLYGLGLRLGEACALNLSDVDLPSRSLRVMRSKTGREACLPLAEATARWLARYLRAGRPCLAYDVSQSAVFLSMVGSRAAANTMMGRLKQLVCAADLPRALTCHSLRHACATHLLQNDADLRAVQELLGHVNLNSTQFYTHLDIRDLHEMISRCHPRGAWRGQLSRSLVSSG